MGPGRPEPSAQQPLIVSEGVAEATLTGLSLIVEAVAEVSFFVVPFLVLWRVVSTGVHELTWVLPSMCRGSYGQCRQPEPQQQPRLR